MHTGAFPSKDPAFTVFLAQSFLCLISCNWLGYLLLYHSFCIAAIHLLVHSLFLSYSLTYAFAYSLIYTFTYWLACSLSHWFTYLFTCSRHLCTYFSLHRFPDSLTHYCICSSVTQSVAWTLHLTFTSSLIHSLTLSLGYSLPFLLHLSLKQQYQSPLTNITSQAIHHSWGQNLDPELGQECWRMSRESLTLVLISTPWCWRSENKTQPIIPVLWHKDKTIRQRRD